MRGVWLSGVLIVAASCGSAVRVQEVGPAGGRVGSGDHRFWIEVPPGALTGPVEFSVTMRQDLRGTTIYDVSPPAVVFARAAIAHLRADGSPWLGRRALATVDDGVTRELPAIVVPSYDRRAGVASGELFDLSRRAFAMASFVEDGGCDGVSCGTPCAGCDPRAPGCMPDPDGPRCGMDGTCAAPATSCPAQGWLDQPTTGAAWVISSLAIADEARGFDLDGRCRSPGDCVDNALSRLGSLGNDHLRQRLLGGEVMVLMELSGVSDAAADSDGSLTVKWYRGQDADEPFFPANNFRIPAGETQCCAFVVSSGSMTGDPPQAQVRLAGRLDRGQLTAAASEGPRFPIAFWAGTATASEDATVRLHDVRMSARLPATLEEVSDGLLGGVLVTHELARTPSPACEALTPLCPHLGGTLLDALSLIADPDFDRDGDGFGTLRVGADGRIAECVDGDGSVIPSPDGREPWRCAEDPRMDDGYSVSYTFSGVRARLTGTR